MHILRGYGVDAGENLFLGKHGSVEELPHAQGVHAIAGRVQAQDIASLQLFLSLAQLRGRELPSAQGLHLLPHQFQAAGQVFGLHGCV